MVINPIKVPREALIDIELPNGDIMPAGTNFTVDISVMAVKNDPWGSDALEFNPDRYKETELHPYQARTFQYRNRKVHRDSLMMSHQADYLIADGILKIEYSVFGRST